MDFIASLSVFGWVLIVLALVTLWQLPPILRMIVFRYREGHRPIPGQDPHNVTGLPQNPDAQDGRPD